MSIITIYKCDQCGAETESLEQFWRVGVTLRSYFGGYRSDETPKYTKDWCRKCVEAAGMLPPVEHQQAKENVPPPPTFEDLVRGIVTEMTGAA